LVETITRAVADETERRHGLGVLVLPALPFGPTPEHRGFGSGFIDLPRELHEAVVEHVLASLADQGFRRIVVWRGCGGHDLQAAVVRFNARYAGQAQAVLPELPDHAIWCRIGNPAKPAPAEPAVWFESAGSRARPQDRRFPPARGFAV
jgi:creatinine amidohydrolase